MSFYSLVTFASPSPATIAYDDEYVYILVNGRYLESLTGHIPYPTKKIEISIPLADCAENLDCVSTRSYLKKTSINQITGFVNIKINTKNDGNVLTIKASRVGSSPERAETIEVLVNN